MRRLAAFVLIALAIAALFTRDRWLPAAPGQTGYLGYVEGETILIGAAQAGRIVARPAERGMSVREGDILFRLDAASQEAELARTGAAVATAEAQLHNLLSGKRGEEQEVTRAQRREAEANLRLAELELGRARQLSQTGTMAMQRLDQAEAQYAQWQARVAQYAAVEAAGDLPARPEEIAAARSKVKEAEATRAQAAQRLTDLSPVAPMDGAVDDTFFEVGEWLPAGQPVVSLLPPGKLVLRFYVPEAVLAKAKPGTEVRYRCDGCEAPGTAMIVHAAAAPEFTPPVIYSQGARAKLVFLVEAKPRDPDVLRPGLPIEVEPLP